METIIYFKEASGLYGVIRFVKSYRKRGFLRRERISYTMDIREALSFKDNAALLLKAKLRTQKDNPDAEVCQVGLADFRHQYISHRFWLICRFDKKDVPTEFYSGLTQNNEAMFTNDIYNAVIGMDVKSETETVSRMRVKGEGKIGIAMIYLNLINDLLNPNFMLLCTSKSGERKTKYFARQEGNRLRLVETSDAAKKFTYREVLEAFESLKAGNKNFEYAVLPAFKENVSYRSMEDYIMMHNISRRVQLDFKLSSLCRK